MDKKILWVRGHRTGSTSLRAHLIDPTKDWHDNMQWVNTIRDGLFFNELALKNKFFDKRLKENTINTILLSEIENFKNIYLNEWENLFKFIIVVNPYKKFLSGYKLMKRFRMVKRYTFNDMYKFDYSKIKDYFFRDHLTQPQTFGIIKNDKLDIDHTIYIENFESELQVLFKQLNIGVEIPDNLTALNTTSTDNFMDYYDDNMLQFVNETFSEDFKYLNYKKI